MPVASSGRVWCPYSVTQIGTDFRDEFAHMIDGLSAKVDEVQAAWDERRNQ